MIKTTLSVSEIDKMIDTATNLRDKVIIAFYADTGCRASELLKIKVKDVDLPQLQVMIPHLKTGIKKKCPNCGRAAGHSQPFCAKCGQDLAGIQAEGEQDRSRLINIGESTAVLLGEWIKNMDLEDRIIDITRQRVYYIIREAAARIGLSGRLILNPETGKKHFVHPHNLRDSLAVDWLKLAGDNANKQKALQDHLGHVNFNTTMRYNKLTPEAVKGVADEVRKQRFGGK